MDSDRRATGRPSPWRSTVTRFVPGASWTAPATSPRAPSPSPSSSLLTASSTPRPSSSSDTSSARRAGARRPLPLIPARSRHSSVRRHGSAARATSARRFAVIGAEYYRAAVDEAIALNRPVLAFNLQERYRARSMLMMLAERDLQLGAELPADIARELQATDAEYDRVAAALAREGATDKAAGIAWPGACASCATPASRSCAESVSSRRGSPRCNTRNRSTSMPSVRAWNPAPRCCRPGLARSARSCSRCTAAPSAPVRD